MSATDAEFARQRALDSYRIVDTLPEAVFDDVARLASALCGMPIALLSLVDRDRQWFKASLGLDVQETPRGDAFCSHAIRTPDALFEVPDLAADPRFADTPLVTGGPHARFYAGMPLVTPGGHAIGTVCVLDHVPRELDPAQREALASLARLTMNLLDSRRRELEHHREAVLQDAAAPAEAPTATGHYVVALLEVQDFAGVVQARGERTVEKLLQQLDARLGEAVRVGDTVDRATGSPEYVVVLQGRSAEAALERVLAALPDFERDSGLRLLAGTAATQAAGEPVASVFLRADEALSRAKMPAAAAAA